MIKGVNLENYLKTHYKSELKNLALIKIDTEGYDVEVLRSIDHLIDEYRPSIIFECFGELDKTQREALYDSISKHGYTLFYFKQFEEETETVQIARTDMMKWKHFDIYAVLPKM